MSRQLRTAVAVRPLLAVGAAAAASLVALGVLSTASLALTAPAVVRSASLRQHGRSLRWTVTLEGVLSSRAMSRQHRSLCLLLERERSAAVFAKLCVAPPGRKQGGARLMLSSVSGTNAKPIDATVKRPSPSTLEARFLPASVGVGYRSLRWQVQSGVEPPACAATEVEACAILLPSRPKLLRMHTPKLVGCVASGRSLVLEGPSSRREIALTFDDGPWNDPPTADFVKLLASYHVPATFFEVGEEIGAFDPRGAIEREMLADGDMIGDHTWSHPDMTGLSAAQQRSQILSASQAIRARTGFTPCLWRPPYGDTSGQLESLARSLGFLTILWNIDPRDWTLPGSGAIAGNVIGNARNGAIADMHFGGGPRWQTLSALRAIIPTLRKRGYRFVTLTKMLGLRLIYQ